MMSQIEVSQDEDSTHTKHGSHNIPISIPTVQNKVLVSDCLSHKGNLSFPITPVIGVFWDIENCAVPKGRSALLTAHKVREIYFHGYREAEFMCVCDIRKASPTIVQELNDAQVTVVHVDAKSKNAADDKLRQAMRRFGDTYSMFPFSESPTPSAVILISGDIDFASDVSDLRYRNRLRVIVLHNKHAPTALLMSANEHRDFHSLLVDLPIKMVVNTSKFSTNTTSSEPKSIIGGHCSPSFRSNSRDRKVSRSCSPMMKTIDRLESNMNVKTTSDEDSRKNTKTTTVKNECDDELSSVKGDSNVPSRAASAPIPIPNAITSLKIEESDESSGANSEDMGDSFDLHITNIDPNLGDWKTIRQTLSAAFGEHVRVLAIWVCTGQDGSVSAVVRVNSIEEGRYAVSQLHRKKIGNKRIIISFSQETSLDLVTLKKEVASLLQDVPNCQLPLFKFRDMFEKRYRRSVSSSDLYKMRDVVAITENGSSYGAFINSGRTISLLPEWRSKEDKNISLYCSRHPPKSGANVNSLGWAEKQMEVSLPNVMIELKVLSTRAHLMLQNHDGKIPLVSFMDCYEAEFGEYEKPEDGKGVPLEHLISCVQGVEIESPENGMKRVQWTAKKSLDNGCVQPLANQLAQLSRELVDLLKTFPLCSLPFSKLIPAYHHHFGKQFRVADYGHFSLSALLKTLPLTIQILGSGQNRVITLSHRAQMKRFGSDLLRVLKFHGGVKKQIALDEFAQAFSQVFPNRQFSPEDYGLCFFSDLVNELVENSTLVALLKNEDGSSMLAIPKREQTPYEMNKTKVFATEVVELMRHSNRCEMPFSKFIPAYHHHFGRQCRVSDYGFTKLAELFDAIKDTVVTINQTDDCSTDSKIIRLTPQEQIKVIGEQICNLVEKRKEADIQTYSHEIENLFLEECGFQLRPDLCDAVDIDDLLHNKLNSYITIQDDDELSNVDRVQVDKLRDNIKQILEKQPEYSMDMKEFLDAYCDNFHKEADDTCIERDLTDLVTITSVNDENTDSETKRISLTPLYAFSVELAQLLEEHNGSILMASVESAYFEKFGKPIKHAQMGFPYLSALLEAIPEVVTIRGKNRGKRIVSTMAKSTSSSPNGNLERQNYYKNGTSTPNDETVSNHHSHYNARNRFLRNNPSPWRDYVKGSPLSVSSENNNTANYSFFSNTSGSDGDHYSHQPPQSRRKASVGTRRGSLPPPLYPQNAPSPLFSPRHHPGNNQENTTFNFEHPPAALTPPVYDMFMHDNCIPGSPSVSPPVVWTYHPVMYPRSSPPGPPAANVVYSFPSPWSPSPMPTGGYENVISQHQTPNMPRPPSYGPGPEMINMFGQQSMQPTMEPININMDPMREA